MAKSFDEKREAFQRMLDGRLPKAVKQVELLANLSRGSDYAYTNRDVQIIADSLDDAVDTVLQAFGVKNDDEPNRSTVVGAIPTDLSEHGADGRGHIRSEAVRGTQPVAVGTRDDGADADVVAGIDRDGDGGRAVSGMDKADIKRAFLMIAKDDRVHGMKLLRSVILGWGHQSDSHEEASK